ncbi:MAG: polysaccharide deacetylase [Gammaproteobacteria bacterium]|nr:polysaccharide deacetylase [Gammaproteobacteria bacterium]
MKMQKQRFFVYSGIIAGVVAIMGLFWAITREQQCQARWQPVLLDDIALDSQTAGLPSGWKAGAPGVRIGNFSVAGGNSVHMLGIGTWLGLPPVTVQAGQHYCVAVRVLADSPSVTAVRTRWFWRNESTVIAERIGEWQMVRRWSGVDDRQPWSLYHQTDIAPAGATSLEVRYEPASDDRIYLDQFVVRTSRVGSALADVQPASAQYIHIRPWPAGYNAAVSFSYDWETAMGGLVHSRSNDDPLAGTDPVIRGMRMRVGLTNSLKLFAPYHFAATYYVNGYNFLDGNRDKQLFMGNPVFVWATMMNGWQSDVWSRQSWFAADPYGDIQSNPAWYFGDLINPVRNAGHDIQSHTFSHFYGGLASPQEWQSDLMAWQTLAATRDVAPATSLAFPWSSSAGMRYDSWNQLAAAGVTSLTRTSWNPHLPQYHIVTATDAHCRPLPGHEVMLVCPDYYLTTARTAGALAVINDIRQRDGMIDFWSHTEEVTTPAQIAAWQAVVDATAHAGDVWVASLRTIAARQQVINMVQTRVVGSATAPTVILINPTMTTMVDVVIRAQPGWQFVDGHTSETVITLLPHTPVTLRIEPHDLHVATP